MSPREDLLRALLETIEAPSKDDSPEARFASLQWALEVLARAGWTNDEILKAAKDRTRKPRGRPRDPDDEHITRIRDAKRSKGIPTKIAREINDGHRKDESIVRRLTDKAKSAQAIDEYYKNLKMLVDMWVATPRDQWHLLDEALIRRLGSKAGTGDNSA